MRTIRNIGAWWASKLPGLFHYVAASANVFCMNQMRFGKLTHNAWFATVGVITTLLQWAIWLAFPLMLQSGRMKSIKDRQALVKQLEDHLGQRMSEDICRTYSSSYTVLFDQLDAIGEGIKMANMLPILLTLINVYGGDLDEHGGIASDVMWMIYIGTYVASGLLFYSLQVDKNYKESETLSQRVVEIAQDNGVESTVLDDMGFDTAREDMWLFELS